MTVTNATLLADLFGAADSELPAEVTPRLSADLVISEPESLPFGGPHFGPKAFFDVVTAAELYLHRSVTSRTVTHHNEASAIVLIEQGRNEPVSADGR